MESNFLIFQASRITTTGEVKITFGQDILISTFLFQPGRVHMSDTAYVLLKDSPYFEIQVKGKTELKVND